MPDTRVPITDAFDDTDEWESLNVELTAEQIEWLERKADERGVSVGHMLRTVLTAQMRGTTDIPSPGPSGDGAPQSDSRESTDTSGTTGGKESDTDTPSIVESLRSASERLDDLTEKDEGEDEEDDELGDTLARLKTRAESMANRGGDEAEDDPDPGTVLMDDSDQSMFDMVD